MPRLLAVGPRWALRQQYLVLARELGPTLPRLIGRDTLEWALLTPADAPLVRAVNPFVAESEVRERLRDGHDCLLLTRAGVPVYYRWDTSRPVYLPYLSITLRPSDGELFTIEAFTHPAFRGRGIHSFATGLVLERARRRGLRRSVTLIAWWNVPARRVALEKAERTVVGTVSRHGIGPWRSHRSSGAASIEDGLLIVGPAPVGAEMAVRLSPRPAPPR